MKTNSLDFDAQALREKILDLAMRGKLVKQDPNDEPASVLLEKIKAEKAELVKEGKIKKSKSLPEVTDEEKPFDIPDSWEWVRLGDVVEIKGGKRVPKGKKLSDQKSYCPYIRVADMSNNTIQIKNLKYVNKEIYDQIHNYTITADDLYFSIAGTIGKVGRVPQSLNGALLTENAAKITSYQINLNYLVQILKSPIVAQQHSRILSKVAQPKLSLIKLKQTFIPLPPLSEQSRIAAKIAQLFALLRKVESSTQQYAKLQTLLKSKVLDLAMRGKLVEQDPNDEPASVLLEKIKAEKDQLIKEKKIKRSKPLPPISDEEKTFEIPDSWEWVRLGEVTKDIRYGFTASAKKSGNSKLVRISDIQNDSVNWNSVPFCDVPSDKIQDLQLWKNDILIARTGGTIGKSYKIQNVPDIAVFASYLIRIRLLLSEKDDYIKYVMQSPLYWAFISKKKSGTGQPNVNATKLSEFVIPFPPRKEQSKIVTKIRQLFSLLSKTKSSNQ